MVLLSKILKLGGFSDQIKLLKTQIEHLGFAKKALPPDTPHLGDKQRWAVNALGQKVVDTGTPVEVTRALYIGAAEKTYAIPELASLRERYGLIKDRCDHVRTLAAMAEKGDEPSADYLVSLLQRDPVPAVRKTALLGLAFAARGPRTPYNMRLIDGVVASVSDEVAEIRGMAVVLKERALREWDLSEIQVLIKPPKRKDVAGRRGECTMVGEEQERTRGNQPTGGGAWQQVRDLAMATSNASLMIGVLGLMSHPVLPVRMAAWSTFGSKSNTSTRGRCRELEVLAYQKKLDYEEQVLKELIMRAEADACVASIMERNRENIAALIEKEGLKAELTASDVEKIVDTFREDLTSSDQEYIRLKRNLQRHQKNLAALREDLNQDTERFNRVEQDLKAEIMSMIGALLEEHSFIIESVNKLCGSNDKGNWYIRRCLIRILEPMAVSGDEAAIRLLEKGKDDRSPYVRRTVQRSLRAVWLAERERIAAAEMLETELERPTSAKKKTEEELAAEELEDALKGMKGSADEDEGEQMAEMTLEEKRRALKALKQRQEAAEDEARINALYLPAYTWKDVDQMIEGLRPKFGEKTDVYRKAIRQKQISGQQMYELKEDSYAEALKMKNRKHRIALKLHIRHMMDKYHDEKDESKNELRAQKALVSAARDNANKLNALTKMKLAQTSGAAVKSAVRFDNYAYGNATGLGSMLQHDGKGGIIFLRVIPCGGLVNDGDTLLKIGNVSVAGMGLLDVKRLLETLGERVPCLVRLTSEKERLQAMQDRAKEAREQEQAATEQKDLTQIALDSTAAAERKIAMQADLLRTVHVTCQPPPFREEYLESIGLDVEIYKGDAIRSLQVTKLLQRNGFSSLLKKCLVDLKVQTLKQLAERYNDDAWISSVGITSKVENAKFKKLLERLAFRYGIRDHVPQINLEDTRPDAHEGWLFISGHQNAMQNQRLSQYRTSDASQDIREFKRVGRTPIVLSNVFKGMEYTVCWHPELKIAVELMHSSAGTLRFAKQRDHDSMQRLSSVERTTSLPGIPGIFDFYVVFSDGRIEPADRLNAAELLQELVSQPPPKMPGGSRAGTAVDFAPRPSTQQSTLPSISGAIIREEEEETKSPRRQDTSEKGSRPDASDGMGGSALDPGRHGILTSGVHLGSPARWKTGFRFFAGTRPSSASSDVTNKPGGNLNTWDTVHGHAQKGTEETPEVRDRAWYVKGPARGPSRGYSGQRTFFKEGEKWLPTNPTDATATKWSTSLMASGGNMGFFGGPKRGAQKDDDDSDAESDIDSDDEEEVLGYHLAPMVGHRVVLRETCRKKFPELVKETGNLTGTVTWVDPTDADGDGEWITLENVRCLL
jgi:hypothetical protein